MNNLLRNITVLLIIFSLVTLSIIGCIPIKPSGETVTKNYEITDFTSVDIGSAFKANITRADTYNIEVTFNKNLEKYIKVNKEGDKLVISTSWNWRAIVVGGITLEAEITMPVITSINFSGASRGTLQGFSLSNDLTSNVSGASTLEFININTTGVFKSTISGASRNTGSISANSIDFEASGASRIELTGTVKDIKLRLSGASSAQFSSLTAKNVDAEVSGASNATVKVSDKLDVSLSGASGLEYIGNPSIGSANVTGASTLRKAS
ncbi:MAG: DUF2807 domain-containing protein [Chloroflexi bacterium]|nr:DUF2807 domain-containing protein [Chloroflexota bacterium]